MQIQCKVRPKARRSITAANKLIKDSKRIC